ncbi:hypothetical protein B9Z19DRAFT_1062029 [Tuber borchii]|uniref:Uncharacterized protein n=1 Tax=Tuber borchii TaxID=42251 RepID=A0A2T7A396_TUBBO|nr:hypothetical protein B9Z19DRAFT_1062029 [Tuber borchii]
MVLSAHGLISYEGANSIRPCPPQGIWGFCGNYAGSVKEPAYSFHPRDPDRKPKRFRSIVLESSWTSTEPEPVDVSRLWHEGSEGRVRVVILVKLDKPNAQNQSGATLKISHCTPGAGATATATQIVYLFYFTEVFPAPGSVPEDPTITMEELFRGLCPPGYNPATVLTLRVDQLRREIEMFSIRPISANLPA